MKNENEENNTICSKKIRMIPRLHSMAVTLAIVISTTFNANAQCPTINSITSTPVLCNGNSDATATVSAAGGTGALTYNWSMGATGQTAANLPAGTYSVTVNDATGCSAVSFVAITQPSKLIATSVVTNSSCGQANGSNSAIASGGTPPYIYSWSNNTNGSSNNNLAAGTYTVTVTDVNNCTATAVSIVNSSSGPSVVVSTSCDSIAGGSISAVATGGAGVLTYNWSNGAASQNVSGLTNGSYVLTVTDAVGCKAITIVSISCSTGNACGIQVSATVVNANCGTSTGSISTAVAGGTAPYTYLWNTGSNGSNVNNLAAGTYTVTISDVNSCSVTTAVSVLNTAGPSVAVSTTCDSINGGKILAIATGGTGGLTYNWSTGASSQNLSGLANGSYVLTVTDAVGCKTITIVAVSCSTGSACGIQVTAAVVNATCGNSTGSISAAVAGGTPPYIYSWSNNTNGSSNNNLAAGTYTVTVADANACTVTAVSTILNTAGPSVAVNSTCDSIYGGMVTAVSTGGTGALTYNWSTGASGQNITNLPDGSYVLTVTDAVGCNTITSVTINCAQSNPCAGKISTAVVSGCSCTNEGFISIAVIGGLAPYIYSWSNGANGFAVKNLSNGTYTVTVTDVNGCTATESVIISCSSSSTLNASTSVACYDSSKAAAIANPSGGIPPFTYQWSNGSTNQAASNLSNGVYTVTITDVTGNTATATALVNCVGLYLGVNSGGSAQTSVKIYPNPSNNAATIDLVLNEKGNVSLFIYDVLGNKVADLMSGFQQSGTYQLPINTQDYSAGLYFVHLKTNRINSISQMLIAK